MKLVDRIAITLGGEAIELRPSLRFALRLASRPGSFPKLAQDVIDGSLSAACEIVRDHYLDPMLETRIHDNGLDPLREPLVQYVLALTGLDENADAANDNDDRPKGKHQSFAEFLIGLYRIGTGWLGWTPADTLDATPAEIIEAHRGRVELLKAVFGGSQEPDTTSLDDKFRAVFGSFSNTNFQRSEAAPR